MAEPQAKAQAGAAAASRRPAAPAARARRPSGSVAPARARAEQRHERLLVGGGAAAGGGQHVRRAPGLRLEGAHQAAHRAHEEARHVGRQRGLGFGEGGLDAIPPRASSAPRRGSGRPASARRSTSSAQTSATRRGAVRAAGQVAPQAIREGLGRAGRRSGKPGDGAGARKKMGRSTSRRLRGAGRRPSWKLIRRLPEDGLTGDENASEINNL